MRRVKFRFTGRNILLIAASLCLLVALIGGALFSWVWVSYGHIVDKRLRQPLFADTAKIYAAPPEIRPGQTITASWVVNELQQAGYSAQGHQPVSQMGTYSVAPGSVTVQPGPQSYHAPVPATIAFANGTVSQITAQNGDQLASYQLEPLLITGLSDQNRAKRRLVTYSEFPQYLVPAVTSIEDRRFFQDGALDYRGIFRSALNDMTPGHHYLEGASTLDMLVAKMFFLTPARTWRRKFLQVVIALQLDHRFSKKQIFQMFANEVPLGQHGSYAIDGFGEAAQAYYGKDIGQLNLEECATLAGMIQSPTWFNPFLHPRHSLARRNLVLDAMVETHDITRAQAEKAKAQPLGVAPGAFDAGEAPWFVSLVRDQIIRRLHDPDYNQQGLRIYTSLDPELQQVAHNAVSDGMKQVDAVARAQYERRARFDRSRGIKPPPLVLPQAALVALDPHTGQVLALVGGTNYGFSQLNHAIVHRPTGSIFKPFVYATAYNDTLAGIPVTNSSGTTGLFTAITSLHDEPTTFTFDNGQTYSPHDFENTYFGDVPAVEALYRSLNNATIELAQMVGYQNVADLANSAGITSVKPTPAMAIGAYAASPMEMAGAYTTFANHGVKINPWLVASVRTANGNVMANYTPVQKTLLDPRVAYLTVSLMEQVLDNHNGTGYRIRVRNNFTAPGAAKTGTSHDAWFAGFTSNLLCVVWVGYDNYSQLNIEGDRAAGPIWGDFMSAAVKLPQYSDTKNFLPPPGVIQVSLDDNTNLLADSSCPEDYTVAFLDGTQPTQTCDHTGSQRNIFQKLFGLGQRPVNPPPPPQPFVSHQAQPAKASPAQPAQAQTSQPAPQHPKKKKKRGFWARLFGRKGGGN